MFYDKIWQYIIYIVVVFHMQFYLKKKTTKILIIIIYLTEKEEKKKFSVGSIIRIKFFKLIVLPENERKRERKMIE